MKKRSSTKNVARHGLKSVVVCRAKSRPASIHPASSGAVLRRRDKLLIGVTGSFGSGKTTVARMFESHGALRIDADAIAGSLLKPGNAVYRRLIRNFGKAILKKGRRQIDQRKLSGIVFSHRSLLRKLNRIMHPEVIRSIKKIVRTCRNKIIILDAPLLIEAGLADFVDRLVVVKARRDRQIQRIRRKAGLSQDEILARIRAQMPLKNKVRLADFVIDNNASMVKTRKQVTLIRRMWWKS